MSVKVLSVVLVLGFEELLVELSLQVLEVVSVPTSVEVFIMDQAEVFMEGV